MDLTWQWSIWSVACGLYLFNIGVGLAAQIGHYRFGWVHHALYFLVFVSAIAATLAWFHPLLLWTLSALCYMPSSQPGSWKHPTAATFGFSGYIASCPWLTAL